MRFMVRALTALLALGVAFLVVGFWGATRTPIIVETTLELPGLPPGTRIRVLHITDTHAGHPDMPRRRVDAIVTQANALEPDLILLTGDYIFGKWPDWPPIRLEDALEPLASLSAPLGVFASMGNHDPEGWTRIVIGRAPEPRLLINQNSRAGPIAVAAINSARYRVDLNAALAGIPPGSPTLLLAHEGDQFRWRRKPDGLDPLVLAGHTHGGQIRLPFGYFPADRMLGMPLCRRGACTINGWRVFVSSGIGTTYLPLRIGVPPEMVMITLVPPTQASGRKSGTLR